MKEKEILKQSMAKHQKIIDEAKEKLAELDKPKLRHGDYGYKGLVVDIKNVLRVADKDYVFTYETAEGNAYRPNPVLGNIFDDLKRNSEDLEKFKVANKTSGGGFSSYNDGRYFWLNACKDVHLSGHFYELNEVIEIHQKLGQLIATAKRKQK